jgi:hypothetical protein
MRVSGTKLSAISYYRGLGNQLYDLAGNTPSLDLRLADNKSLVDAVTGQNLVTFTRASSGTYVGSDGLIKTATTNEPRFDHNPTTGESLGLLVEEARTNLNLYSEDFGNATYSLAAATVSTNTSVAPDGTTTADTVSSSGTAVVSQLFTKAASAITFTGSLFVKGTVTAFSFTIDDGNTVNRGRAVFNLSTGTVSSTSNDGTFTGTTATITALPNGWYRLTVTTTTNILITARLRSFWTGAGTSIDFWGAQLETGSFPTSYIPTTTATVTRSADVASITGSNFSSWYRQDEGTVLASAAAAVATSILPCYVSADNGTSSERLQLRRVTSGTSPSYRVVAGGQSIDSATKTIGTASGFNSQALAYASNNYEGACNGTLEGLISIANQPAATQLQIGNGAGSASLNGTIRRLVYWPRRLPNSTLQAVTQ